MTSMANTLILAAAIVIAGFLAGGRYSVSGTPSGAFLVDKFTGATTFCALTTCKAVDK